MASERRGRGCRDRRRRPRRADRYGAHLGPGTWTGYGPLLREPEGPIHWAGAETSPVWNGYMDGAVRSGERVAAEIAAA